MATGTAGTTARKYHQAMVHYLRKRVQFSDGASAVITVGKIPAGSTVVRGGIVIVTAFNAGTANVGDLGTTADPDGFATDLALGTVGVIVADEMATTDDAYITADTDILFTLALTGTAATTGDGYAWVEYLIDN